MRDTDNIFTAEVALLHEDQNREESEPANTSLPDDPSMGGSIARNDRDEQNSATPNMNMPQELSASFNQEYVSNNTTEEGSVWLIKSTSHANVDLLRGLSSDYFEVDGNEETQVASQSLIGRQGSHPWSEVQPRQDGLERAQQEGRKYVFRYLCVC